MSDKKGFIIPYGTAAQIGRLISLSGSEAAVKLLGALEVYSQDGTEPEGLDLAAEMLFESMRAELDRDREHYNDVVDKRKAAAAARWNNANASICNAPDANASVCNANDADIDPVGVIVADATVPPAVVPPIEPPAVVPPIDPVAVTVCVCLPPEKLWL